MLEHYVTLFDSLFLPQGLALHASLERQAGAYALWVICVDDQAHEILLRLALPNVRPLALAPLETPELLKVKPFRTRGEYCWTLAPFAPRFVFEADSGVERVTYVDADLWFRKNPSVLLDEFSASGKGVLITDHAYAPEYDSTATSGQYCVQFMVFHRERGETVRKWWEERCIEWCYARIENGKFGDQKYLDDWPERFPSQVHVLSNKEVTLAPWNATRFPYGNAVFWHFHALRILGKSEKKIRVNYGPYPLPRVVRRYVYAPYILDLQVAVDIMKTHGLKIKPQINIAFFERVKSVVIGVCRHALRIS